MSNGLKAPSSHSWRRGAMNTKQTAAYTGFSESFLRQSRCYGNRPGRTPGPPFVKIGGKVLYLPGDLDEWMRSGRVEPQSVEGGA